MQNLFTVYVILGLLLGQLSIFVLASNSEENTGKLLFKLKLVYFNLFFTRFFLSINFCVVKHN